MAYPVQTLADGRTRLSDGTLQEPQIDDNTSFFQNNFNPTGSLSQGTQANTNIGPVSQPSQTAPIASSLFSPGVALSSQIGTQSTQNAGENTQNVGPQNIVQHYINDPRVPFDSKKALFDDLNANPDHLADSADTLTKGGYQPYNPTTMNPDYKSATQATLPQGNALSSHANSVSQAPQAISDWYNKGVNTPQNWGENAGNFLGGVATEAPQALGDLMGGAVGLAGGLMKYGTMGTPLADIGNRASQGADTLASIPEAGGKALGQLMENNLQGSGYNPESYSAGAGKLTSDTIGFLAGLKGAKTGAEELKVGSVVPDSVAEDLSTKANRFSAGDIRKFTNITGETPGQFAVSRGMTEVGADAVEQSAQHYADSMQEADKAFGAIDGNFRYTGTGPDMLKVGMEDLASKFQKTLSPEAQRLQELMSKYDTQGLTMSETNEFKRMFQNNNKFTYDQSNSEPAQRATNILDGIRNWQFKTAEENGLSNIADINQTTQGWRAYSDMLEKNILGKSGNNGISLTDWVVLSGGRPENMAMLMAKKFAQSDYAKQTAIKTFANPSKEPIIQADLQSIQNANQLKSYGNVNPIRNSGGMADNPSLVGKPQEDILANTPSAGETNVSNEGIPKYDNVPSANDLQATQAGMAKNEYMKTIFSRIQQGEPIHNIPENKNPNFIYTAPNEKKYFQRP